MGNNKSMFQYVLMGIFGALFLAGFIMFAVNPTPDSQKKVHVGRVTIWGTFDQNLFNSILTQLRDIDPEYEQVEYIEKSKTDFNNEILEGLATGDIPDLILISNKDFLQNANKLYKIDYSMLSDRDFKNSYLEAFQIYTQRDGIWGVPFMIDPMVMFYNKRLFRTNAIIEPPKFWSDLVLPGNQYQKLRVFDNTKENVILSPIALGEWNNIKNYKEILYTLFLQKNNSLVVNKENQYKINDNNFQNLSNVIKFYTDFSDSTNKMLYYWNKNKPEDQQEFLAGNLGMYLGYTSEIKVLRRKNPNLDFVISEIPMFRDGKKVSYAKTWVMVLPKQCPKEPNGVCKNRLGALKTALALSSEKIQKYIIDKMYLPPIRKSMILKSFQRRMDTNGNIQTISDDSVLSDANKDIFYREAIYSDSILDLNPKKTNKIFEEYIDAVNTKLKSPISATLTVQKELEYILKNMKLPISNNNEKK